MALLPRHFVTATANLAAGATLGAVLILIGAAKAHGEQPVAVTLDSTGKHAFAVFNVPAPPGITWNEAARTARQSVYQDVPGHLAVIHDKAEDDFITGCMHAAGGAYAWIGGYQDHAAPDYREPDGGWHWVTGEPIHYTHWNVGEPNNAPAHSDTGGEDHLMLRDNGTWNDAEETCGTYIVEYDLPPAGERKRGASKGEPNDSANSSAALRLLSRVRRKLLSYRTYQETITLRLLDAEGAEQDSSRAELTWAKPNRFRLVGTSPGGKITAVGDGRQFFLMDRSEPDTYVLRAAPPFSAALAESLTTLSGYNVPTLLGLLSDAGGNDAPSTKNVPWVATAQVVESLDGDEPTRTLVADLTFPFDTVPKMRATYKIIVGARDDTLREEQLHFTYQDKAFTLSIVHEERTANPTLRPDAFVFHVPANAERVRHLKDGPGN